MVANAAGPAGKSLQKEPFSGRIKKAILMDWVASGETTTIKISGNSMFPFLRDGDTATVTPSKGGVTAGDIVVYFAGEVLLIHRVVKARRTREGTELRTKGDSCLSLDPPVKESDLIGKAVAVRRGKTHIGFESAPLRALGFAVALASYTIGLTLGRLRVALRVWL
jgi:signal peptidase I